MNRSVAGIAALAGAACFACTTAAAQDDGDPRSTYGYLGASLLRANLDLGGCAAGFACDESSIGLRAFAGAWNTRNHGLEVSYFRLGKVDRNGGETKGHGASVSFLLGAPVHEALTLFAKLGASYTLTSVRSPVAGVPAGDDRGLGWSLGAGAQFDLDEAWSLRLDWDLHRIGFAGSREKVSWLSLGAAYRF